MESKNEVNWRDLLTTALENKNVTAATLTLESDAYSVYKNIVERYKNDDFDGFNFDDMELFLQGLDFIYISGGVSPLRDSEYDELHAIFNEKTGRFITNKNESGESKKVKHVFPELKGTLEKVHYVAEKEKQKNAIKTHKSLETWLKNCLEKLPDDDYSVGFYKKIDGISVVFEVEDGKVKSAITRGDADTGEGKDVTANFKNINFDVPAGYPNRYGIKTEVVMPKKEFDEYSKKFKSDTRKLEEPRSAASGLVNADYLPPEMLKYLRIMELEHFVDGKFIFPKPVKSLTIHRGFQENIESIRDIISDMAEAIQKSDVNCDGVVVRFTDPIAITTLGRDTEHSVNKFEVAYKFPPEEKETVLKNIEFQIGLLGTVSPVAKVEPVKMKGKTIKSISLGSIDRMNGLKLRLGDKVIVKYEIIPYLDKVGETEGNTNPIVLPPEVCPYCLQPLQNNPVLMCVNTECPSRVMGKILNYCVKMNIKGIGESIVQDFFNAGILTCIEDLYRLETHKAEIVAMDRYGEKKYDTIVKSVKKNNETDPGTLLGSLGIKSIGRTKFQKILSIYYMDELMAITEKNINKLCSIPGIGESTAIKVIEGLRENKETIEFLLGKVKLVKKERSDYNIIFSGIRNRDFEKHLENMGYEIKDSVNANTKFVIVGDLNRETTKTKKAKALGVPIIEINRAYKDFGFIE